MRSRRRSGSPPRALERNAQPKGGYSAADRRCRARARHPPGRGGRSASSGSGDGVTAILQSGETHRGRSRGDRRAGRRCCAPACRRSIRAAASCSSTAIGRIGYGAGILGKIYLRFPAPLLAESPKWFGRLPDSPQRRGTFNTWVSHRAGNRAADPAQLLQRPHRHPSRPRRRATPR